MDDAQWIAVAGVISTIISGYFAIKASRISNKINQKVGNGFAGEVQTKLDLLTDSTHSLREITSVNTNKLAEIQSSVDTLKGQFTQHIVQHNWRD